MVPPTIGPELSTSPSPLNTSTATLPSFPKKRASSLHGGSGDSSRSSLPTSSRTSSAVSIPFSDDEVALVTEEGVKHSDGRLHAKRYRTREFANQLLDILLALRISTWSSAGSLSPENLKIAKVSGSLTNAVFFVSYPSVPSVKTLLLRIYGPSSGELISRPHELHTLHILSSRYHIGPRVYGTFENGRVEEYFDSTTLSAAQLRDPTISRWIGARMAELHRVDIEAIEGITSETWDEDVDWEIAARKNIHKWLQPAREVLRMPSVTEEYKAEINFDEFVEEWRRYMSWLRTWEDDRGASRRVFAHNDAQYGNLLRLRGLKEGTPDHRQIIVVDFEYASPNSAAYDIANHFHEWTADYHDSAPHILDPARYPTEQERLNFYKAYLTHACLPFPYLTPTPVDGKTDATQHSLLGLESSSDLKTEVQRLEAQVRVWSPASHAMWAVWGLVQAREDLELASQAHAKSTKPEDPEFDYLGYTRCRIQGFRREIKALGL
ncbi:hypothetical protein EW145_g1716 [Phellinidium pouzarii]|uniref:Choline kinase N-terminal domain-containing protein n=1 Tax=Phellinidium pouzarii TaxID=167371 RepID=A0A4S4LDY2_9AGAM|nr:hypothetical protein EW145_g1716 [Phellinidium pouzarii]